MKNKITFLPSWSKIKRLFLAFPTMENRMNCIDEFLQLLYVIASTYNKKTLKIEIDFFILISFKSYPGAGFL